jgi:hypothetical protein
MMSLENLRHEYEPGSIKNSVGQRLNNFYVRRQAHCDGKRPGSFSQLLSARDRDASSFAKSVVRNLLPAFPSKIELTAPSNRHLQEAKSR